MKSRAAGLVASLSVLVLAACASTSTADTTTPTPTAPSSPSAQASSVPVTTDPCQVVTQSEASQLTGVNFGAGLEQPTSDGNGKLCFYGAQTTNVFEVLVAQANSASAAQADWDAEKAKVEASLQKATSAPGVTFTVNISDTTISGADRAASGTYTASFSGHTISGTAVYLLKGAVFCAFVDITVGQAPPSLPAMQAQAQTVLGRLP